MNMVNFVLIIVAFKLTGSNAAVSGIVLSFIIPAIVFGMLAGVYVDRWNKKKVLFYTNILRLLLVAVLALIHTDILVIYLVSFAVAVVTQFFIPAETPLIPKFVPDELLNSANALFGMGIYGSIVFAYALSGPVLILFGSTNVFIFIGAMFLLAAFFVSLIKKSATVIETKKTSLKKTALSVSAEIKAAIDLVVKTRDVFNSLFLLTLSQLLILLLAVIGPGYARDVLNVRVDEFPLLFVAPGAVGMIVGALILANIPSKSYPKHKSATLGVLISSATLLLLPFGSKVASDGFIQTVNNFLPSFMSLDILHFMMFLSFVLGFANALVFVPSNTILQEKTGEEIRGRIYGALNSMVGLFSLFPIMVVGGLADIFGVSRVITGIGICVLLIGVMRLPLPLNFFKKQ